MPEFVLAIPTCPTCGEPANGTIEVVKGRAELTVDDQGNASYTGATKLWYEEQFTVTDDEGRWALVCANGHDWFSAVTPAVLGHAGTSLEVERV